MSGAVCSSWYKSIPCVGVGDALSTLVAQVSTPIQHTHKSAFPSIVELGISCSPNSSLSLRIHIHAFVPPMFVRQLYSTYIPKSNVTPSIACMIFHLFRSSSSTSALNSHHRDRIGAYLTYTTQVSQHHLHHLQLQHRINNIIYSRKEYSHL